MHAIVGLGNHGTRYIGTRHNAGYRVIEALARHLRAGPTFKYRWSLCATARFQGQQLILSQPLTYMNRSGLAVVELIRRHSLERQDILIVHDDLDLPLGKLRLKQGGGIAGHRGLESILEELGSLDFKRLRFGIDRPPPGITGADYVLGQFDPGETELLNQSVEKAVQIILTVITEGLTAAMNKFN